MKPLWFGKISPVFSIISERRTNGFVACVGVTTCRKKLEQVQDYSEIEASIQHKNEELRIYANFVRFNYEH